MDIYTYAFHQNLHDYIIELDTFNIVVIKMLLCSVIYFECIGVGLVFGLVLRTNIFSDTLTRLVRFEAITI
jgi:hypothetical protein